MKPPMTEAVFATNIETVSAIMFCGLTAKMGSVEPISLAGLLGCVPVRWSISDL